MVKSEKSAFVIVLYAILALSANGHAAVSSFFSENNCLYAIFSDGEFYFPEDIIPGFVHMVCLTNIWNCKIHMFQHKSKGLFFDDKCRLDFITCKGSSLSLPRRLE